MPWFKGRVEADDAPANSIIPIVAGQSIQATRGLWVGTAGTATIITANGETVTNFPLVAGWNPISITQVVSYGTAANAFALY